MNRIFYAFLFGLSIIAVNAQNDCASAVNLGTPTTTSSCTTFNSGTSWTGNTTCITGSGEPLTYLKFCTNSNADCVSFSFSGLSAGSFVGTYTACSGGSPSGGVTNSGQCIGSSSFVYTTSGLGLTANTCYYLVISGSGSFTGGSVCTQVLTPSNDFCASPMQISTTVQNTNNYCFTATAGDPAPAQWCAGSLENNAWFYFQTSCSCTAPCTVVVTISSIVCSGGGSGFQIGNWTGSCGSLTNIGCTSGSGGTVTETITGLTPCQNIVVGLDGNAGANCSFGISASNTQPLPVEMLMFTADQDGERVRVFWVTSMEVNSDYFVVERSLDGKNFEYVTQVQAVGYSDKAVKYSMHDSSPYNGTSYYRIKQVDKNGEFKYHEMAVVNKKDGDGLFTAVPNPANSFVEVNYAAASALVGQLTIADCNGRILYAGDVTCGDGNKPSRVDMAEYASGLYFVTLNIDGKFYKTKLVKN